MTGTVLITGAAGFLGGALAEELSQAGRKVVGLDIANTTNARPGSPSAPTFPLVLGDVADAETVSLVCDRYQVNRIVHAGGVSGRSVLRGNPAATLRTNVQGTISVFEAARSVGVARVLLCSSGSVYGRTSRDPLDESAPLTPVNAYGASKAGSEAIMQGYVEEFGVSAVALRIFQAFGPGRKTQCNIRAMIEAWRSGDVARVPYSAAATMQYVYVTDVVHAMCAALDAPMLRQRAYNIAGGTSLPLGDVVPIAAEALPGLRVAFGDDPFSREYCLGTIDQSAAERDLGYVPQLRLGDAIAAYARVI